ncbi:deoxynucleoside kinase, partial [Staphylococcus felis]
LEILKERIAKRERSFENQIEDDYLLKLKKDYADYYDSLSQTHNNILWIDTTHIDFIKNPGDYDYILARINELIGGTINE